MAWWPQLGLTPILSGLDLPVHVTSALDGSGRLFVVEQRGRVLIARNGVLKSGAFLDITGRVGCCGERGLLSVAFPPEYAGKGYFYVDYTDKSGATVVSRFQLSSDPDRADPGSEKVLLQIPQPYANHNGGQLAFGPRDGFLYIGMGDGGSGGDPQNRAQDPGSLLGKLLRIDVESPASPYAVPADNPFVQLPAYRAEIWAVGLRNPWRFAFDRQTGDLYIGDVGQGSWEEIDFQPWQEPGGQNYGWRIMEGSHCYDPDPCDPSGLVLPVAEYDHSLGCSVTGGVVYRGQAYPRMNGLYVYGDYCSGRVWGLRGDGTTWQNALLLDTPYSIVSFGDDELGNVYLVDYAGSLFLLRDEVAPAATPSLTPTGSPVPEPISSYTSSPVPATPAARRAYLPIIVKG